MIVFPNAKINLGLQVLRKRDDGFHDIETIMVPVPLYDGLEVVTVAVGNAGSFTASGIPVPDDGTPNICLRAYDLMQQYAGNIGKALPPAHIHLHKHIPIGAGLGGGSSDAAYMLKILSGLLFMHTSGVSNITRPSQTIISKNNLITPNSWGQQSTSLNQAFSDATLHEMAASLGSDCPFFLYNSTMLATGRGEKLQPINIPGLHNYVLVLAIPPIHVATAAAYQRLTPAIPSTPLREAIKEPVKHWRHCIHNDFEPVVFPIHPTIKRLKETLYEQGAIYASMSGSGSAVFGLFAKSQAYDAEKILQIKKICANLRIHVLQQIPQHQ